MEGVVYKHYKVLLPIQCRIKQVCHSFEISTQTTNIYIYIIQTRFELLNLGCSMTCMLPDNQSDVVKGATQCRKSYQARISHHYNRYFLLSWVKETFFQSFFTALSLGDLFTIGILMRTAT